jgi:hypothetical protein
MNSNEKMTHSEFILKLVEKIFNKYKLMNRMGAEEHKKNNSNIKRLIEKHFADLCPSTEKKGIQPEDVLCVVLKKRMS